MPGADDWTLVTVTYNSADQLRSSWQDADLHGASWIVVDNASSDDSGAVAVAWGARLLRLPANVGFGAANNLALAEVMTPYVAFVNPDVRVDVADLARLAAVVEANEQALVSPQLLNPDGTEQPNARGLPYLADKVANRLGRFPFARLADYTRTGLDRPTYCAWTIGAAVAGRTDVVRALGGWDERYFIYYEDHDLGLRAWRSGHPVVLDPAVRWMHEWQRATTRLRWTPWKHEVRSARVFYGTYPQLLWRWGRRLEAGDLGRRQWRGAREP